MFTQGSERSSESEDAILEIKRQIFHLVALLLWVIPILYFPEWLAFLVFILVLAINYAVVKKIDPFRGLFSYFIDHLERDSNLEKPAVQAFYANLSIFISFLIFGKLSIIGVLVLAVGDSFSTLVGKFFGKNPFFYTKKKTAEGTVAFFVSVYIVLLILFEDYREAVLISSLSAFVESFEEGPDDNLTIPLLASALAYLV